MLLCRPVLNSPLTGRNSSFIAGDLTYSKVAKKAKKHYYLDYWSAARDSCCFGREEWAHRLLSSYSESHYSLHCCYGHHWKARLLAFLSFEFCQPKVLNSCDGVSTRAGW